MSGDHDLGYKQLFAHPELVRDLLAGFTSFACFRALEPSAFERVNASYVSERFSERHGDMVWRVRLGEEVIYVYLLLEFQSQAERWMALRMQVYVGLLYQDLVKRREFGPDGKLPPVLPVVFYNGAAPWNANDELRSLVGSGPAELGDFQASQRYLLIDQRTVVQAQLGEARNVVAELFRLELSDTPDILISVTATLAAWLCGDDQAPLRRSIAAWIARLQKREFDGATFDEIESLLEGSAMGERIVRKYATWADFLEDRGLQRGLAQGREEGREQGREEVLGKLRIVFKRQLVTRFGALPDSIGIRIDQAPEADIERWMERVVNAPNVDAVLTN
jgi:predicted transposase YdaD